jgi:hypothetical protein
MMVIGDTLTYTLGAMKPETANADVITADAVAKQEALNKVIDEYWQWLREFRRWFCADLLCFARSRLRKWNSIPSLLIAKTWSGDLMLS